HFRLLDELVSEGLAIPLDEFLQENGCLVACAARAAGWIAALTWLEGHLFSPLVAGTKEPAMRGHHGPKKPGAVSRPGGCSESSFFYMSRGTSGKCFVLWMFVLCVCQRSRTGMQGSTESKSSVADRAK